MPKEKSDPRLGLTASQVKHIAAALQSYAASRDAHQPIPTPEEAAAIDAYAAAESLEQSRRAALTEIYPLRETYPESYNIAEKQLADAVIALCAVEPMPQVLRPIVIEVPDTTCRYTVWNYKQASNLHVQLTGESIVLKSDPLTGNMLSSPRDIGSETHFKRDISDEGLRYLRPNTAKYNAVGPPPKAGYAKTPLGRLLTLAHYSAELPLYFVAVKGGKYELMPDAVPIDLAAAPGHPFFVHPDRLQKGFYVVSDAHTGMSIGQAAKTPEAAASEVQAYLEKRLAVDSNALNATIDAWIAKHGCTPNFPRPPRKMSKGAVA